MKINVNSETNARARRTMFNTEHNVFKGSVGSIQKRNAHEVQT